MGFSIFSFSTITSILIIVVFASFFRQMYDLMYPLANVSIKGTTIPPLWNIGQNYSIVCFLSSKRTVDKIDVSILRSNNQIIYEQDNLMHNLDQDTMSIDLDLLSPSTTSTPMTNNTRTISKGIFNQIYRNASSVYMHVVVVKQSADISLNSLHPQLITQGHVLHGAVKMIKYDIIPKHFHHRYLLSDWDLVSLTSDEREKLSMTKDTIISYWKPEVSIKLVSDFQHYPENYVPHAVARNIVLVDQPQQQQPRKRKSINSNNNAASYAYKPSLFVDEIGLTSDKYIHLNHTVQNLPLKISIGPMATERWYLMEHLESSLRQQKESFGFQDKDIDDVRRMISETSLYYLTITLIASILHLLFEMLAFQSDIAFWQANKSLAGLSIQSLLIDWVSQTIIFLYLLESDTSLLVLVPAFLALILQMWKIHKATGITVHWSKQTLVSIEYTRWKWSQSTPALENVTSNTDTSSNNSSSSSAAAVDKATTAEDRLAQVSMEADYYATRYLSALLFPLILVFILRSLLYEKHASWYSWAISSMTSCVYTFGFITMCPQLYINHRLKSVSHLPWLYLIYKFLNTFVDDLFAFIIKMPLMHRLSVFRDDIVFLIYIYQRYIYQVDLNRPIEK